MGENFYKVLQVSQSATQRDIKIAYRKLVQEHHPDVSNNPDEDYIKTINIAYETLSDEVKKTRYDETLRGSYTTQGTQSYRPPNYSYTNRRRPSQNYRYGGGQGSSSSFSLKTQLIGWTATIGVIAFVIVGIWGLHYYTSEYYYEEGLNAEKNNNNEQALSLYQLAIRDWGGKSVEASLRSAEVSKKIGAFYYMIDFCKKGLSYEPDSAQAARLHFLEATAYYQTKRYEKAEVAYLKSLKFNYNNDSIYNQLGWIYVNHLKKFKEAAEVYSFLLASNSINLTDYYYRGISYQFLGKHQKAVEDFLNVLEDNPYSGKILFQLGRSYLALGQKETACEYLQFAMRQNINIDPKDLAIACN